MKTGDCITVDYVDATGIESWKGICVSSDGYKFTFLVGNETVTWSIDDLRFIGAEVISESR